MNKKMDLFDLFDLFDTAEGRKLHEQMIKERLPKVLERQRREGFYNIEEMKIIEQEILEEYEKESK